MFGGDRFEPLIGKISLARDMKAAMQDDDEDETAEGGQPAEKRFDAKGKEIISPEVKAKRDAKERKISAEVSDTIFFEFEMLTSIESGAEGREGAETGRNTRTKGGYLFRAGFQPGRQGNCEKLEDDMLDRGQVRASSRPILHNHIYDIMTAS
jgi:hypothetical protein